MEELIAELKAKRESQGLSIQDLFQRTRINTEFLEALEAGNFDILPEAYIKLFLKKYAQEVKLDGDEIVKRFEQLQWKEKAAEESVQRPKEEGTPGWVIGVGGALVVGVVAALVIWQSDTPTYSPAAPDRTENVIASRIEPPAQTPQPADPPPRDQPVTTPPIEPASPPPAQTQQPDQEAPATDPAPAEEPELAVEDVSVAESETTPPTETPPTDPPQPSPPPPVDVPVEEVVEATEDPNGSERVVSAYSLSLRQDLSASTGQLTLTAVGLEPTGVIVTTDGEPVFDGLVDSGRRTSWRANDRFSIEIEKGSGLQLQLQDEILPVVGAEGRQVRLYISRFSIWVEEIETPSSAEPDTASP